ncbi:MAG: hypothetical protein M3245_02290 [Actinomycetota bacterium]|nr:hypothetical protein [Actinomycetota bacterium]
MTRLRGEGRGLFLAIALGVVAGACTGTPPSPAPRPPSDPSIVRRATPRGEAAVQLVVEPEEVTVGETVEITLVNRGDVKLLTGTYFEVERRQHGRWVQVPWPENVGFPTIGFTLLPGSTSKPKTWPSHGVRAGPGRYRAVDSAHFEDPELEGPDTELEVRAEFRIRAATPRPG